MVAASRFGVLVILGLSVAACERDGADHREVPRIEALDPSWDLSTAGDEQLDALMDGTVTRREYVSGFKAFEECMNVEDFHLNSVREIGGIFEFNIPGQAVKSGVDQRCYLTHFAFVDATWQFENTEERAFIERVNRCLGFDLANTSATPTTRVEAERALSEAGREVSDCPE